MSDSFLPAPDAVERAAWLRLTLTPGLGPRTLLALLAACGLPSQIFAAPPDTLATVVGVATARRLSEPAEPDVAAAVCAAEAWLAAAPEHDLLTLADPDYPSLLLETGDPPPLLYLAGARRLLNRPALAIVGSRNCTRQGAQNAAAFAEQLGHAGLTIVSGLALGIDAAAHEGALRTASSTIAVLGTGLDRVYPARNRALADAIRRDGLLVSDLPLGAPPLAAHFPRRNRVIAGLARGVLVVEAAVHSGSLITAHLAADAGRDVFALPGSIHAPHAKGCHRLLKEGAALAESADDVLQALGLPRGAHVAAPQSAGTPHASLLARIGHDPVDLDTLAVACGLPTAALSASLLELELTQHVERLPGNRYQRLR